MDASQQRQMYLRMFTDQPSQPQQQPSYPSSRTDDLNERVIDESPMYFQTGNNNQLTSSDLNYSLTMQKTNKSKKAKATLNNGTMGTNKEINFDLTKTGKNKVQFEESKKGGKRGPREKVPEEQVLGKKNLTQASNDLVRDKMEMLYQSLAYLQNRNDEI